MELKLLPAKVNHNGDQENIDFEYADDALDSEDDLFVKIGIVCNNKKLPMEKGKEEFPEAPIDKPIAKTRNKFLNFKLKSKQLLDKHETTSNNNVSVQNDLESTCDSDRNNNSNENKASTLPSSFGKHKYKKPILIPKKHTNDGTNIYFWCDLPKKLQKGYFYYLIN